MSEPARAVSVWAHGTYPGGQRFLLEFETRRDARLWAKQNAARITRMLGVVRSSGNSAAAPTPATHAKPRLSCVAVAASTQGDASRRDKPEARTAVRRDRLVLHTDHVSVGDRTP
jgi:hypothetical protein